MADNPVLDDEVFEDANEEFDPPAEGDGGDMEVEADQEQLQDDEEQSEQLGGGGAVNQLPVGIEQLEQLIKKVLNAGKDKVTSVKPPKIWDGHPDNDVDASVLFRDIASHFQLTKTNKKLWGIAAISFLGPRAREQL